MCPGSWLRKGGWEEMAESKAFDFYALSWGILGFAQKVFLDDAFCVQNRTF